MDLEGVFGIIGFFGSIPLITWLVLNHKLKIRVKSAELVAALIAKDKDITPDLIKSVGFNATRSHADLRKGLILLAVGIALFLFGGMIPEEEAQAVFGGLAMFPVLISFAYLAFWYFVSRKDEI
ncbi:MAG: hypothetical protein JKX72_00750 [Robiginitomaculum sp.]|nr:hypothetical protein [Robiginitomaculum sp.]